MPIYSESEIPADPVERALQLQTIMAARATHTSTPEDNMIYISIRKALLYDAPKLLLPESVRVNRNLDQFWQFVKSRFSSYDERRNYLREQFEPLLDYLERQASSPVGDLLDDALADFSAEGVHALWAKAVERQDHDPEGAITAARSLIEAVCKRILEEAGEKYSIPDGVYRQASELLTLAPNQQADEKFRRVAGTCNGLVGAIYEIRNSFGDAHGRSSSDAVPLGRHAELAINIAGSLAVFLVRTRLETCRGRGG